MKIPIRILFYTGCLAILVGCATHTHPRKKTETIRQDLLALTSLGSSLEEVEMKLKARHMSPEKSLNTGFMRRVNGKNELVGVQSVWADIGDYRTGIFETTAVVAYWGFNESGTLIEIWVKKYVDSL